MGRIQDRDELIRLIDKQEASIRSAFLQFIGNVQDPKTIKEINDLLASGDIEGALGVVDRYVVRFANILPQVYNTAGPVAGDIAARALGVTALSTGFDPSDPAAASMISENRLRVISETTQLQRDSIRQALNTALIEGQGPRQTAVSIKNSIGLTANQEAAVRRYRELLESGNKEALSRQLRDRRFDRTIASGRSLTTDQINRMVDRYRDRMRKHRAETIARTETTRAVSLAQQEALRQIADDAGIPLHSISRTWNVTSDDRTRDAHSAMQGQTVGVDEPFLDGDGNQLLFPGDPSAPIETTINCRCVLTVKPS